MDWKAFATSLAVVFLAELGDKTQLATLALSSGKSKPMGVFLGAWLALTLTTAMAVLVGWAAGRWIPAKAVSLGAAFLFLGVGAWMLYDALKK